jgi:hypothetical protein
MSFWQMFFSVGSFIAYWINFACARNRDKLGHWDWKMVSNNSKVALSCTERCTNALII